MYHVTKEFFEDIPKEQYPLLILSDNMRSLIGARIKRHEEGFYNHLMWLIGPNLLASQDFLFKKVPLEKYLKNHRLKMWCNFNWTKETKKLMIAIIEEELNLPWYKRLYDPLQILGMRLNAPWLQLPGFNICSDRASYLAIGDKNYKLYHPSPTDVNNYCKEASGYQVYCRYTPD